MRKLPLGWFRAFLLVGAGVFLVAAFNLLFPRPAGEKPPPPVLLQAGPSPDATPTLRVVRVPVADVRREPHPGAELVTQALYGAEVRVAGRRDEWLRVEVPAQGDYPGYVLEADLAAAGPPPPDGSRFRRAPQAWVVESTTSVRSGPGEDFASLVKVHMGSRLTLDGEEGRWLSVRLPGDGAGWLPADAAVVVRPGAPLAPSAEAVIRAAERLRGAPYLWGGMTAEGIDCSALTYIAFGLQGIVLPRDADLQQFNGPGFPVNRFDLRAGDLVFFSGNRQYATHVGIYRGDGTFVHAAPRTGGVAVSALSEPYWDRLYFGARRVLPQP